MSGFNAFSPLNTYRIPCPYPPTTIIPACNNCAVFCPAFEILSTSPELTVTVCCTMKKPPRNNLSRMPQPLRHVN